MSAAVVQNFGSKKLMTGNIMEDKAKSFIVNNRNNKVMSNFQKQLKSKVDRAMNSSNDDSFSENPALKSLKDKFLNQLQKIPEI